MYKIKTLQLSILALAFLLSMQPITLFGQNKADVQQNWSNKQKKVWEKEKSYWKLRKAANFEGFMSLWDKAFIGWSGPETFNWSDLKRKVKKEFKGRDNGLNYELRPHAVKIFGSTAVTFYSVLFQNDKGDTVDRALFHHSWRKQNGTWKIIAGMSVPSQKKDKQ